MSRKPPTAPPAAHTVEDLRRRLFEAIDGVTSGKLSAADARVVSEIAQVIVNSAKVEVDYLRATDGGTSGFLEAAARTEPLDSAPLGPPDEPKLPPGILGITRHRLEG